MLKEQPGLRVSEIALVMEVSEGTVRNDLNALEKEGFLTRVHGGAVLTRLQNNCSTLRSALVTRQMHPKKNAWVSTHQK